MNTKISSVCTLLLASIFFGAGLVNAASNVKTVVKEDDEVKYPLGCRDVGYQMEMKILKILPEAAGERNSLYFIFNAHNYPIKLYHMRKEDSTRSLYLNHVINARQWAVLSTSEKYLKYICTKVNPHEPYGEIIDCADSVKICEFAKVRFGLNNRGNVWLVKGNTKNGAVSEVVRYGIIPQ